MIQRVVVGALVSLLGCSDGEAGQIAAEDPAACTEVATQIPLPDVVPETSGVAVGRRDSAVLWTHNDSGGDPALYAVTLDGALLGTVAVTGAANVDWEDIEIAACGAGSCLYVADVGDNSEDRDDIVVFRVPEPAPTDGQTDEAEAFRMVYPDRPHDAEAIFVLPGEGLFVVTKGRSGPAELFRYPGALRSGEVVTLERIQAMTDEQPSIPTSITGASASVDGRAVAIRTYTTLDLYRVQGSRLEEPPFLTQALSTLAEPQGEAVALGADGLVVLTSEAGQGSTAGLSLIRCELPN